MQLQLVAVEVALGEGTEALQRAIALALQIYGEPLRWAITAVDSDRRVAQVEAVVIVAAAPLCQESGVGERG
ncbi:MAG: hypothetical protein Fur0046_07000 [Cyanobacteria bacterium J069]|nr:MAG: hypothetical protein D6742_04835 [Cyanobacteria bacterium J069]